MPTVFREHRCAVCHEDALLEDSDLVLCQCGIRWTTDEQPPA
jgi:hypothetical protein